MLTESEAIALLRKHAPDERLFRIVLAHSQKVKEIALRMAKAHPEADKEFIRIGALLHDIGRFSAKKAILHGIIGAEILRKEGLPDFALVCERHLGAGISKEEVIAEKLPLPNRNFLPLSVEEKIITAADNLVDNGGEISEDAAAERYRKELGPAVAQKVQALFDELKEKS
ncbi:MAG: HD domain-containing protein [Nanoarchaeota archaeon]